MEGHCKPRQQVNPVCNNGSPAKLFNNVPSPSSTTTCEYSCDTPGCHFASSVTPCTCTSTQKGCDCVCTNPDPTMNFPCPGNINPGPQVCKANDVAAAPWMNECCQQKAVTCGESATGCCSDPSTCSHHVGVACTSYCCTHYADPEKIENSTINNQVHSYIALQRPLIEPYFGIDGLHLSKEEANRQAHHKSNPRRLSSAAGRHVTQSLHWKDSRGRHVKLTYNASHTPNHTIVNIDDELEVIKAECETNSITLYIVAQNNDVARVTNDLVARLRGGLLTGRPEWGCAPSHKKMEEAVPEVILRRITAVSDVIVGESTAKIQVSTVRAGYGTFFEHAKTKFSVSAFPKNHIKVFDANNPKHESVFAPLRAKTTTRQLPRQLPRNKQNGRRLWGSLFSWIGKAVNWAWHAVVTVAKYVGGVLETVAAVIKAVVTGDFDLSKKETLADIKWNTDDGKTARNKTIQLDDGITCDECFVKFDISLNLEFHVKSWSLENVGAFIEGDISTAVHNTVTSKYTSSFIKDGIPLAVIHLPQVCFSIGVVPVCISTTIPVTGGYQYNFQEAAIIKSQATASGHVRYGFQIVNGIFNYVHDHTWVHSGSFTGAANISGSLQVYILPVVQFNVDSIGGPNVGLKGFVEPTSKIDTRDPTCSTKYSVNFGLQLTVGAQLDIHFENHEIFKHNYGPWQIWSHKWPLASGCIHFGSDFDKAPVQLLGGPDYVDNINETLAHRTRRSDDGKHVTVIDVPGTFKFFETVTYHGKFSYKENPPAACGAMVPALTLSVQFTEIPDDPKVDMYFTAAVNHNFQNRSTLGVYNHGCILQSKYLVPTQSPDEFLLINDETQAEYVHEKNCTTMDPQQEYPVGDTEAKAIERYLTDLQGYYNLSEDFSTLLLQPDSECINAMLLQRDPLTGYEDNEWQWSVGEGNDVEWYEE